MEVFKLEGFFYCFGVGFEFISGFLCDFESDCFGIVVDELVFGWLREVRNKVVVDVVEGFCVCVDEESVVFCEVGVV